jgi:hypothetical protein
LHSRFLKAIFSTEGLNFKPSVAVVWAVLEVRDLFAGIELIGKKLWLFFIHELG